MDPIAFKIGSLTVHWYGVMMATAFLLGLWTASRRGLRDGLKPEQILDIGPWLIVGTIVGARTLHVISYWKEQFADKPVWEIFMVHHGGLVYYGGLIGASLACILYVRFKKLQLWRFADALAPSIPLGYIFGRIGCFLNGCCFGKACELPWAVHYPAGHETHPVGGSAIAVHPSQLYDSLLSLALYVGLAWLYRRKKFNGQVFAAYLIAYAFTRSFVETFRGDYTEAHLYGPLTPAHLISIGILAAGSVLFIVLRRSAAPKAS